MTFPHYTQLDAMDCGPTCLRMVAKHYGRSYTLQNLRERSFITREGVSMLGFFLFFIFQHFTQKLNFLFQ